MKRAPVESARCCAEFPYPAEQYQGTPLDLNKLLVKHPAAISFVKVQGDSMVEEGMRDGDLLIVDRSLRPANGDVFSACVDGESTVKICRRDKTAPVSNLPTQTSPSFTSAGASSSTTSTG